MELDYMIECLDKEELQAQPTRIENAKLCYQPIWKSYWYARYGEFVVVMHKALGYVNATQLCKTYEKHFYHWSANKATKAMIAGLAAKQTSLGNAITAEHMMITVEGGSGAQKKIICGTYVHPILLPHIISWLDPQFADAVSILINDFYGLQSRTYNLESILEDEKKKKKAPPPESEPEDEDADNVSDGESEDEVVPPKLKKCFKIFARKDRKFPYQAIETLQSKMVTAVKRFQKTPMGTTELLLEINDIPDVVSLYNLIKSSGLIQTNKNAFTSKFSRDVLLEKIFNLSWTNITKEAWVQAVLESDLAMSDE